MEMMASAKNIDAQKLPPTARAAYLLSQFASAFASYSLEGAY